MDNTGLRSRNAGPAGGEHVMAQKFMTRNIHLCCNYFLLSPPAFGLFYTGPMGQTEGYFTGRSSFCSE